MGREHGANGISAHPAVAAAATAAIVLVVTPLSIRAPKGWLGPGLVVEDLRVTVEAGVVLAAGPAIAAPDGEEIHVDGFVMPAVADRHVHVELSDPMAIVRGGVTAVRDLAWPPDRIFPLAALSEMPSFEGPLIRACGPMLTTDGGYPTRAEWAPEGTGRAVWGPEDAAGAVGEIREAGGTAVKVGLNADAGPTLTDAELLAIVDAAREADLPVTVHAQGAGQVERALGAGVDELAHTPWTPLPDEVIRAAAATVRIVSTLDICGYGHDTPELRTALDNLRRFVAEGGEVVYGTDLGNGAIPPGIHQREVALLNEAGVTGDALLAALARAPLASGAPADLVVLGGDPLEGIEALTDVRLVMRAGRIVGRG